MARSKVTSINDRYELTFLAFYRDGSVSGNLYHEPTLSSKKRFADVITRLFKEKRIKVYQPDKELAVYTYFVKHKKMSNNEPRHYGFCPDCGADTVIHTGEMSEQDPVTQEWHEVNCWECESCGLAFNDICEIVE